MSRVPASRGGIWCLVLSLAAPALGATTREALPVDDLRENALQRLVGQNFKLKRTAHFVIAYDTTTELVESLTIRLEATCAAIYRFCEYQGIVPRKPGQRLEVLFFNEQTAYERYCATIGFRPEGTYGVYHELSNRSAFFNIENAPQIVAMQASVLAARRNLDELSQAVKNIRDRRTIVEIEFGDGQRRRLTRREVDREIAQTRKKLQELDGRRSAYTNHINLTVIQHETAHQVLYNARVHARGASNPPWLVEGLACLFETPPGKTGAGFAAINQLRLQDFRNAVAGDGPAGNLNAADFLEAVEAGRIASPREIVLKPELLRRPGPNRATHYAAAWALTTYLQRVHGNKLAGCLQEIARRTPGRNVTPQEELELFERHFGPMDETFLRRFATYLLNLPVIGIGVG
ncbi:MAG TPA: DUF1570 domain-containing protein [Phycisphaerae bacterium]|nr:DUF1570 domain-containing protein [Phycisphaerae bacterium]